MKIGWIDMTLKKKMIISFVIVYVVLFMGMTGHIIKDVLIMQDDLVDIKRSLAQSKLSLEHIDSLLKERTKIPPEPMVNSKALFGE